MKEEFFKRIEKPIQVRKTVLESSKGIIQVLKGYQKILDIRNQKNELVRTLKTDMKEIKLLLEKLTTVLPESAKMKLVVAKAKKSETTTTAKKKPVKQEPVSAKHPPSEIELLERKLKDIESKLNKLD